MTILFGSLGEGRAVRAFSVVAAFAGLAAVACGTEAERYAEARRPTSFAASAPEPAAADGSAVDYATTGSAAKPLCRRELVVLGPCGDPPSQR